MCVAAHIGSKIVLFKNNTKSITILIFCFTIELCFCKLHCATLGRNSVSWVRLQSYNAHYQTPRIRYNYMLYLFRTGIEPPNVSLEYEINVPINSAH